MAESSRVPLAKFDKKGRIVCPICSCVMEVPPDRYLAIDFFLCQNKHKLFISEATCFAVNEILAKTRHGNWRKEPLKNFEGLHPEIRPDKSGSDGVIP
jgi:hypothetical protein